MHRLMIRHASDGVPMYFRTGPSVRSIRFLGPDRYVIAYLIATDKHIATAVRQVSKLLKG